MSNTFMRMSVGQLGECKNRDGGLRNPEWGGRQDDCRSERHGVMRAGSVKQYDRQVQSNSLQTHFLLKQS